MADLVAFMSSAQRDTASIINPAGALDDGVPQPLFLPALNVPPAGVSGRRSLGGGGGGGRIGRTSSGGGAHLVVTSSPLRTPSTSPLSSPRIPSYFASTAADSNTPSPYAPASADAPQGPAPPRR